MKKLKFYLSFYLVLFSTHIINAQAELKNKDSLDNLDLGEVCKYIDQQFYYSKPTNNLCLYYLKRAKKQKDIKKIIDGYFSITKQETKLNLALKYADSAIILAKKGSLYDLAFAYITKGDVYQKAKKYPEALDYFLVAKNIETKDIKIKNRINSSIAEIKNIQGKYEEAISIFKQLEKDSIGQNVQMRLSSLLSLSDLYRSTKKPDISEIYITKGIELIKKTKSDFYMPYFLACRGQNCLDKKQYNKAIDYFSNVLNSIKNNNDFANYGEVCFYIGECYRNIGKPQVANNYYKKVDSIFVKHQNIYDNTINSYTHLINFYKNKNDYQNAMYYSDQFIKADKVLDKIYRHTTNKIAKTYDIEKVMASKEGLIDSLRNNQRIYICLSAILVIGLLVFFYILRKTKLKLTKERVVNEKFKQELEELLIKLKENKENPTTPKTLKTSTIINDKKAEELLLKLDKFEKEQLYLNKEYTLDFLSKELNTNSTYLSKIINEYKGCNFTEYINTLRITYIIVEIKTNKKYLNYTVEGLSQSCGFNSVQTFTRAFIKHTNTKPSEFIKSLNSSSL